MESYRDFARVYDEFMDQTPYDEWLLNILNIFKEYKIDKDTQVLDLGCGTGKMARKLAREGYQVTAVDNSMDMLEIAASEEDDHILYVLQDIVSLELPQQVDAAGPYLRLYELYSRGRRFKRSIQKSQRIFKRRWCVCI